MLTLERHIRGSDRLEPWIQGYIDGHYITVWKLQQLEYCYITIRISEHDPEEYVTAPDERKAIITKLLSPYVEH